MAISSALRRRAPWAAAAASARGVLATRSSCQVRPPHPHSAESAALFSSRSGSAPQPGAAAAAAAHLVRVISFEISCAQKDCRKRDWAKELGEGFPFEILDKEGTSRITLIRRDQKGRVEVEAHLPSPVDSVERNGNQEDQSEDGNCLSQYCIPLTVRIHNGAASWLEISCSSYPDKLVIDSLAFGPGDGYVGLSSVEAKLSNFPEELQKAFYSYLKSKGISSDVTNFLHAYMINKECHEYLSWLRKLKSLIKN